MTNEEEPRDIKVVALDIYRTVLCGDDHDDELPARRGLEEFFDICDKRKIKVVSTSDADIKNVKIDLKQAGVNLDRFDNFYRLDQLYWKDFMFVVRDYGITPRNLLVIGDSYKDIEGAIRIGAFYLKVPEYMEAWDDFDFSKIRI